MKNFPSSRRWLCLLAAAVATATFATSSAPAFAASDPVKEQQNVRKQQKAINSEISNLKKTDAQLEKQLAELDKNVKSSKAVYDSAAAAAAAAARAAELARGSEAKTTENYNRLKASTKNLAVEAYMHGFDDSARLNISAEEIAKAATRNYMGVQAIARGQDVTEKLAALRQEMIKQREAAEAIEAQAAQQRAAAQSALGNLQSNRSKQQKLENEVDMRLERALSESAALAAIDKKLSAEIAKRSKGGSGGSGRLNTGNVDTVRVRGITVARSIGDKVAALLEAAEKDGVPLSGYGYRDSDQQVALRKAHCGTSNYDIYEKPSNECHPPTARPGASMHERGLAIDFTYNNSIITSKSSPAFKWLSANAKKYGLYNLPSEPWHWSTNGN